MLVYIYPRRKLYMKNKTIISINDLKSCENCGNVFLRKVGDKIMSRCPACNVWKKEDLLLVE